MKATGVVNQMLTKHAWVFPGGVRKKVDLAKMEIASQPAAVSPAAAKEEAVEVSGGVSDVVNPTTREAEAVVGGGGGADRSEAEAEATEKAWKDAEDVFN